MADRSGDLLAFDAFTFDRRALDLRREGRPIKLQQQPARVLALLLERSGELVTRDELRQALWGDDVVVDFDRGLNFCISQIRAVLEDDVERPRYLETLRGRGYRFIGTVAMAGVPAAPPATASQRRFSWRYAVAGLGVVVFAVTGLALSRHPGATSIGVAPFTTAAATQSGWAASLHTQILAHLAHAGRMQVVDLADDELRRTGWRLEGSVDQNADQYRVTVTLRQSDGTVRWSDVFDGPPGDWIEAQNEMSRIIAEAVRYHVQGPEAGGIERRVARRKSPFGT